MKEKKKKLILKALDNNYPNEGELATKFEKIIAEFVGTKYAIAVTSGTVAMFLSLKACGIGPNDEVIVPEIGRAHV